MYNKIVRLFIFSFSIVCLIVSCSGCANAKHGNANVDYHIGEESDGSSSEIVNDDIPKHLTYDIYGNSQDPNEKSGNCHVDADIENPDDYGKMPLIFVEEHEYLPSEIKKIAENVFDGGKYELFVPVRFMPDDEIDSRRADIALLMDNYKDLPDIDKKESLSEDDINRYVERMRLWHEDSELMGAHSYDEGNEAFPRVEKPEEVKWTEVEYQLEEKDFYEAFCYMKGKIGEKEYVLRFNKKKVDGEYNVRGYQVTLNSCSEQGTGFTSIASDYDNLAAMYYYEAYSKRALAFLQENSCIYSEDEAKAMALEYVKKLGGNDFVVTEIFNATGDETFFNQNDDPFSNTEDYMTNRYVIYLGRDCMGYTMPFEYYNYSSDIYENIVVENWYEYAYEPIYQYREYAVVVVTNDGVVVAEIHNPMNEQTIGATEAEVTDFEKLDKAVQAYFKKDVDHNYGYQINRVVFGMAEIKQEDSKYVYVPAVYYYLSGEFINSNMEQAFVFNAIDGTLISRP